MRAIITSSSSANHYFIERAVDPADPSIINLPDNTAEALKILGSVAVRFELFFPGDQRSHKAGRGTNNTELVEIFFDEYCD